MYADHPRDDCCWSTSKSCHVVALSPCLRATLRVAHVPMSADMENVELVIVHSHRQGLFAVIVRIVRACEKPAK